MSKIALITGSSRGIGAATGIRLAAEGYDVCVNFLKHDRDANAVVDKIRSQGLNAIAVKADVSQENDVKYLSGCIESPSDKNN